MGTFLTSFDIKTRFALTGAASWLILRCNYHSRHLRFDLGFCINQENSYELRVHLWQ
jgi:hypothetical protein